MTNLNFEGLMFDSEVEFPKRGRKAEPLNPSLVDALHKSFANGSVPAIVIPNEQVKTFKNYLSRAGRELNYRIEQMVEEDKPRKGYSTYHFRTRALRKKAGQE